MDISPPLNQALNRIMALWYGIKSSVRPLVNAYSIFEKELVPSELECHFILTNNFT